MVDSDRHLQKVSKSHSGLQCCTPRPPLITRILFFVNSLDFSTTPKRALLIHSWWNSSSSPISNSSHFHASHAVKSTSLDDSKTHRFLWVREPMSRGLMRWCLLCNIKSLQRCWDSIGMLPDLWPPVQLRAECGNKSLGLAEELWSQVFCDARHCVEDSHPRGI